MTFKRSPAELRPSKLRNLADPVSGKKYKKIWVDNYPKPLLSDIKPNDLGSYSKKMKKKESNND